MTFAQIVKNAWPHLPESRPGHGAGFSSFTVPWRRKYGFLKSGPQGMSTFERINPLGSSSLLCAPIFSSLYECARLFPSNNKVEHVFSKLILVGRVLGTPLEKRPDGLHIQDCGRVLAASRLIASSRLHALIRKLDSSLKLDGASMNKISECHGLLERLLVDAGAKSGSEMAAAYLHVHRKSLFPLMGAKARIGAKLLSETHGLDAKGLPRVTRGGGYAAWIAFYVSTLHHIQAGDPGEVDLLQVNEHLEQWAGSV